MSTLGRRVGMLEGAVQQELKRRFSAAVVLLRETMAPEHARLVAGWMREQGLGDRHADRSGRQSHPCGGQPSHACSGCIDRLDPPALVRAVWIMLFEYVERGVTITLPPEVAQVYLDHADAAPAVACPGCSYRLPARDGRLAYIGPCPVCSQIATVGA